MSCRINLTCSSSEGKRAGCYDISLEVRSCCNSAAPLRDVEYQLLPGCDPKGNTGRRRSGSVEVQCARAAMTHTPGGILRRVRDYDLRVETAACGSEGIEKPRFHRGGARRRNEFPLMGRNDLASP